MDFVACQSFAGGFDLGATQAGLRMVHKVEQNGGFGLANVHRNRQLTGADWTYQVCSPAEWEPVTAQVLLGNPPCSGFSPLSPKEFRGVGSKANSCMFALIEYAAKIQPEVVVFESVAQAFSGGRSLMQYLRHLLEDRTGARWGLWHVKHNAVSCGGAAIRRRYFWVASRAPFGVEEYPLTRVPLLSDVIGDLRGLASTWEAQAPREPPSWWLVEQGMRREIVDGHRVDWTPGTRRGVDLIRAGESWGYRENIARVARRIYERTGELPRSWDGCREKVIRDDFNMGFNQLVRWRPDGVARVITGGALQLVLHPWEDRPVTHREVARIMGFPDDWNIRPLRNVSGLRMTWGKGITVQCGRWIAQWVKSSIEGDPGTDTGTEIGDREYLIDHTNVYRRFTTES